MGQCLAETTLLSTTFCWRITEAVARVFLIMRMRMILVPGLLMCGMWFITIGVRTAREVMAAKMLNSI